MKTMLRRFHEEEEGLEAIQVVMIVAVASVCLLVIKEWWPVISDWVKQALDILME